MGPSGIVPALRDVADLGVPAAVIFADGFPCDEGERIKRELAALVLLLTALEGFQIEGAAAVMRISTAEANALIEKSWADVNRQMATSVLVIEDESVIAIDIAGKGRHLQASDALNRPALEHGR